MSGALAEIRRFFSLYTPFASNSVQSVLAYKLNFFVFSFGGIVWAFVPFFLWESIFLSSPETVLQGFTFDQMSQYVFVSYVVNQLIGSQLQFQIADEVRSGAIAMHLIKPLNYRLMHMAGNSGRNILRLVTVALPILAGMAIIRGVQGLVPGPDPLTYLLFFVSVGLAFLTLFLFDFIFGLFAFYVTNTWGMNFLKIGILMLFSGRLIPLAFFPEGWFRVLELLPFASLNHFPILIYLGKFSGVEMLRALGLQVFWVLAFLLLGELIWQRAQKRLSVQGG